MHTRAHLPRASLPLSTPFTAYPSPQVLNGTDEPHLASIRTLAHAAAPGDGPNDSCSFVSLIATCHPHACSRREPPGPASAALRLLAAAASMLTRTITQTSTPTGQPITPLRASDRRPTHPSAAHALCHSRRLPCGRRCVNCVRHASFRAPPPPAILRLHEPYRLHHHRYRQQQQQQQQSRPCTAGLLAPGRSAHDLAALPPPETRNNAAVP